MPIKPVSFIPALIEQIFSRYSKIFDEQRQNNTFSNKSWSQLFTELDTVLGDDLKLALRILDEQTITIYTSDKAIQEIAEITEGRTKHVVKLFPNINYCQCTNFANNVLQLEVEDNIPTTSVPIAKYTCQHVLALRLAKLLQAPCIRTEVLPIHKFDFILKQIDSSNIGDILNKIAQYMN